MVMSSETTIGTRLAKWMVIIIRDSNWDKVGEVDGNVIRDSSWDKVGEVDGEVIRDSSWNKVGEIDGSASKAAKAAAGLLLLL
jgi:hypothetical protein